MTYDVFPLAWKICHVKEKLLTLLPYVCVLWYFSHDSWKICHYGGVRLIVIFICMFHVAQQLIFSTFMSQAVYSESPGKYVTEGKNY